MLISSHILDELSKLATHYGFIDGGRLIKEISASELESLCRKCTRVKVSDTKALCLVLDDMGLEYETVSDDMADIYGAFSISVLVEELSQHKCEVLSMNGRDESLESYYINLLGKHGEVQA